MREALVSCKALASHYEHPTAQSGSREACPPGPHTTGHAGPRPAVPGSPCGLSSTLSLPRGLGTQLHRSVSTPVSVPLWSYCLPRFSPSRVVSPSGVCGTVEHAGLRELRLRSWERRSTGSVVFVSCDWDWVGREGGLIEFDADYGFKSFSLSW